MAHQHVVNEIFNAVWRACDTFRGVIDPAGYKDYILTMLFVKYLSDVRRSRLAQLEEQYKGSAVRIKRALARERFIIEEDCTFEHLYEHRNDSDIGQTINRVLERIEDTNKAKLHNVFRNIDFNSEANLGQTRQRNKRLCHVLEDLQAVDLRPDALGGRDIIGDVYEFLIGNFAARAGKKAGEFYTPPEVSELLAELLAPKPGDRICDPTCGSGSLLIKVAQHVGSRDFSLYGQEMNGSTWALCKMNMFLHEVDAARVEWEDTIRHPQLLDGDSLMKFDIVVANPPFSLDKWGADEAKVDRHARFTRGIPPKSKGDYAFISHMIATAVEGSGRVGVVVPHGVLFRSGSEGKIRRGLIEENLLHAVIGLPANLFYGAGIPAALILFDKSREPRGKGDVLFIDASDQFEQGTKQNRLRPEHIARIVETYRQRKNVEKYAHVAPYDEIAGNDFHLNIPRYVDTFEPEPAVDLGGVQQTIETIEQRLAETRKKMDGYLRELGVTTGAPRE